MGDWSKVVATEERVETVRLWRSLAKTRAALAGVLDALEHATFDHECNDDNCERCEVIATAKSALQWPGGKGGAREDAKLE